MELIIAMVLFIGLVASWLVLPGSSAPSVAQQKTEAVPATIVHQSA